MMHPPGTPGIYITDGIFVSDRDYECGRCHYLYERFSEIMATTDSNGLTHFMCRECWDNLILRAADNSWSINYKGDFLSLVP